MKSIIGAYANGDYNVMLFSDGTKLRITSASDPKAALFESVDLKITNKCCHNCPYCYEASVADGKHADVSKFKILFDTMHPFTELAIGGGNPLLFPNLNGLLKQLTDKSLVPNMTINYRDLYTSKSFLQQAMDEKLLYGLGVSMPIDIEAWDDHLLETIKDMGAVMHCIIGLVTEEQIKKAAYRNMKILFLGYKHAGRGYDFLTSDGLGIRVMSDHDVINLLPDMINDRMFEVISFDNLAIDRCNIRMLLNAETFNRVYMGDDGTHTMYIDLVDEVFAESSSINAVRFKLFPTYTAQDVWDIVRDEKKGVLA